MGLALAVVAEAFSLSPAFEGAFFLSDATANSPFCWDRALLADLGTGEPSDISETFLMRLDVGAFSGVSFISGEGWREAISWNPWAGVPSRGNGGLSPGGTDTDDVGLDGLSGLWNKADAGCAWGSGSPGGRVGVPARAEPCDSLEKCERTR